MLISAIWLPRSLFFSEMSNLDLLSAGFSAILGTEVVPQKTGGKYSIHDLFSQTYIMKPVETVEKVEAGKKFNVYVRGLSGNTITIQVTGDDTIEQVKAKIEETEGISTDEIKLIYTAKQLENHRTINNYGIQPDESIFMVICTTSGGSQCAFNTDELHPSFDYDFSNVKDDGTRYMRGGFQYKRPYGWKRIAIKVVGKYGDNTWLGPDGIRTEEAPGEWPVSYHGTNMKSAKLILKEGYKPGSRELFGRGIYTSPNLEMIEKLYAQEFTYQGKTYKIVLQNRVNPDQKNGHLQIIPAAQTTVGADYWLSRGGSTADVRPYGILIREVSNQH